jgi:DNA-binding MarR family transcriptional regulator
MWKLPPVFGFPGNPPASAGRGSGLAEASPLQHVSAELTRLAGVVADHARQEAERRCPEATERVTARQLEAVLAPRYARSAVFGMELANPGWSLLLELFRAHLEGRPVRIARLATDARVALTTALRWIELLRQAGFVRRDADPGRPGGVLIVLTDAGAEAMEDYFVAIRLGWAQA